MNVSMSGVSQWQTNNSVHIQCFELCSFGLISITTVNTG